MRSELAAVTFVAFLFVLSLFTPTASSAGVGTITVSNTADSGPGSLRQAILDANAASDLLTFIEFDIPGPGPHVIQPATALPPVQASNPSAGIEIVGESQPGADCSASPPTIQIVLDGRNMIDVGLHLASPGEAVARGIVVQGFTATGILATDDAIVACAFVGTDVSGTLDRGNGVGVLVQSPGTQARVVDALVSGNGLGVEIGPGSGASIDRSRIGTGASGLTPLANDLQGVAVDGVLHFVRDSTISGNGGDGLLLRGDSPTSFSGNTIGAGADGATALGNGGSGIAITTVGGSPVAIDLPNGNVIAHNGDAGVRIVDPGHRVAIRHNSIFANGGLAIDIGAVGPDAIDPGDGDGVPNPPVIESAVLVGGSLRLIGHVDTLPTTEVTLDFFVNGACDPSGFGEAEVPLATETVLTDGAGHAAFIVDTAPLPVDSVVTATATRAAETSEVSACAVVSPLGVTPPIEIPTLGPGGVGALGLFLALAATHLLRRRRSLPG